MQSLDAIITRTTSVRVTRPGEFNPARRPDSAPLFAVSDRDSIAELARCLAVDSTSFAHDIHLMTAGDLQLNLFDGHELLAAVVFIHPDFLRWDAWPADARLKDPAAIAAWLARRGWSSNR